MTLHSEPDITDNDGKPYLSTDTVHSTGEACAGRGEVWLRGPGVTAGRTLYLLPFTLSLMVYPYFEHVT